MNKRSNEIEMIDALSDIIANQPGFNTAAEARAAIAEDLINYVRGQSSALSADYAEARFRENARIY